MTGVDELLDAYDGGRLTRRELVTALALVAFGGSSLHAQTPAVGRAMQLNHVTLFVKDVQKSMLFYQRLLGMPVLTPQPPGVNLRAGEGFVGLYPADDRPAAINHFCLGLANFNADDVLRTLKADGLDANIRLRGDTKELYFTDPDGIRVQLQDVRYIGGTGLLGDRPPK